MCRSIKTLRTGHEVAATPEVEAAALQFVRKVSGFRQPSERHRRAFDSAVSDIAVRVEQLLQEVTAAMS